MNIAAIDIGTNSVRLLRAVVDDECVNNKCIKVGDKQVVTTRIGEGIDSGYLSFAAMKRTSDQLKSWSVQLSDEGVDKVFVIATSAVRDAKNSDDFVKMVYDSSGLDVEIISGDKEAELGFMGVCAGVNKSNITSDKFMVIDVGGGSTELILGETTSGIQYAQSLQIGAVRMSERFGNGNILEDNLLEFKQFIDDQLDTYINGMLPYIEKKSDYNIANISDFIKRERISLIGIGGTATSFGTMDLEMTEYDRKAVQGYGMSADKFEKIELKLNSMSNEQRYGVKGLQKSRADVIVAGGQIILSAMKKFGFDRISLSDYDNLEGLLLDKLGMEYTVVVDR